MGSRTGNVCRDCGTRFLVTEGGGFFFDELHCEACGGTRGISHQELGDLHLAFVKGLPGPYAMARMELDRRIKAEYPGAPLSRDEYHAAAEATLERCGCGGRYRYDAPARCPTCRSTQDRWDPDPSAGGMHYD